MARTIRDEDESSGVVFERVQVKHATDKAMLCVIDGDEHWVPHSQVHDDSDVYYEDGKVIGDGGKLVVKPWWAEKNGLSE